MDESHVEHAVGLVEDEAIHVGEIDIALPYEVEQTPGRGDEDIGAAAQTFGLRLLVHPAVYHRVAQIGVFAVLGELLLDLYGQLARGREYEGADARLGAPLGLAGAQTLDDGDGERRRLARSRLRYAYDVAAVHRLGDGLLLYGCG